VDYDIAKAGISRKRFRDEYIKWIKWEFWWFDVELMYSFDLSMR
jgi:hypothetical protein